MDEHLCWSKEVIKEQGEKIEMLSNTIGLIKAMMEKVTISTSAVEKAMMGDLATRTPGMMEEHREMMDYIRQHRESKRGFKIFIRETIYASIIGMMFFYFQDKLKGK